MKDVLATVDSRTKLAGHNRLELLIFGLGSKQRFGINVFKVREVLRCPSLTPVPKANPAIKGIADIRGQTLTIIDLAEAIGMPGVALEEVERAFIIITEYNRAVQGFLVHSVDRIVNLSWQEIMPPPVGTSATNYVTAVTRVDGQLVEIIDVEQIFSTVVGISTHISEDLMHEVVQTGPHGNMKVLVVDDSFVARNQVKHTLDEMGLPSVLVKNGAEALNLLKKWASAGSDQLDQLLMVISDIEMPMMDGYTLTSEIRRDERLQNLYVVLHTSLSGNFNQFMVKQVGANRFIPKFHPDDLAQVVLDRLRDVQAHS
ncbi:MAG: chemotaxis protein CheV [Halothiobacillaceae bacterium]|jgi:two-component system chemotaxis response regulator CheV